jgi:hypothetical protein
MILSRLSVVLPILATSISCAGTTTVKPETVTAHFALASIDNRPLPTPISVSTPGPTGTVFAGTLDLAADGTAVLTEDMLTTPPGIRQTHITQFEYRIKGGQIEIGSFTPCPINAICAGNRFGSIIGDQLILNVSYQPSYTIFYLFQAQHG